MMQQRSEPYTLALSRRSAHGDESVRRGIPARCPGRGRLAAIPLGRAGPLRSPHAVGKEFGTGGNQFGTASEPGAPPTAAISAAQRTSDL